MVTNDADPVTAAAVRDHRLVGPRERVRDCTDPARRRVVRDPFPAHRRTPTAAGATAKKAAPKKVAAIKLTDKQLDLLKLVHGTEGGYLANKKAEAKSLESLATKKLIKKGAKDKESGFIRYHVSKAGEKHVASSNQTA